MLHAELHGKLDDTASGLERREDILTSTVFGTLLVAGATEVLVDWYQLSPLFGWNSRTVGSPRPHAWSALRAR